MFQLLERDLTRRLIFGLLIVVAVAGLVVAVNNGRPTPNDPSGRDAAIEALIPHEGADVLRQSTVGIDLADGYRASLIVNNQTIPDDQLGGDQALSQYTFTPGEGQVLESLSGGQNCVIATYWRIAEGRDRSQSIRWCFRAA